MASFIPKIAVVLQLLVMGRAASSWMNPRVGAVPSRSPAFVGSSLRARVGNLPSSCIAGCGTSLTSFALAHHDLQNLDSTTSFPHALTVAPYNLNSIQDCSIELSCFDPQPSGKQRRISMKPFCIDVCPSRSSRPAKRSSGDAGPDLLTKAVSPRKSRMMAQLSTISLSAWGKIRS